MTDTVDTVIEMVEIPVRADSLIEGPEMFQLEIGAMLGDPRFDNKRDKFTFRCGDDKR